MPEGLRNGESDASLPSSNISQPTASNTGSSEVNLSRGKILSVNRRSQCTRYQSSEPKSTIEAVAGLSTSGDTTNLQELALNHPSRSLFAADYTPGSTQNAVRHCMKLFPAHATKAEPAPQLFSAGPKALLLVRPADDERFLQASSPLPQEREVEVLRVDGVVIKAGLRLSGGRFMGCYKAGLGVDTRRGESQSLGFECLGLGLMLFRVRGFRVEGFRNGRDGGFPGRTTGRRDTKARKGKKNTRMKPARRSGIVISLQLCTCCAPRGQEFLCIVKVSHAEVVSILCC